MLKVLGKVVLDFGDFFGWWAAILSKQDETISQIYVNPTKVNKQISHPVGSMRKPPTPGPMPCYLLQFDRTFLLVGVYLLSGSLGLSIFATPDNFVAINVVLYIACQVWNEK